MDKQIILFDLDGTLTDPKEGITKSVQYALESFGINVEDQDQLCCFIGPPLKDSFMEYYHFSEQKAYEAVVKFREYFASRGLYENQEYEGIRELLSALKEAGKSLYVATSKPEVYAKQILKYFGLEGYFSFVGGADIGETRVDKADVIRYVLAENQILQLDQVIMVGDRKHDCLGAKEVGIDCIGVLYGYGSREELECAGADYIIKNVDELNRLLLNFIKESC